MYQIIIGPPDWLLKEFCQILSELWALFKKEYNEHMILITAFHKHNL